MSDKTEKYYRIDYGRWMYLAFNISSNQVDIYSDTDELNIRLPTLDELKNELGRYKKIDPGYAKELIDLIDALSSEW